MTAYIDAHRDHQSGVASICRILRAATQGFLTFRRYRAAKTGPPSNREICDEQLIGVLGEVHRQNYSIYGENKMHAALTRRGWRVGRKQTRRLVRMAELRGQPHDTC